ncbi:HlyD family efflux transporter periplasmic adaptor subunit [Azohydromonas caseinilytica]|uniref:HlyD family efflux transporter periplasmic adaptor subunit n=1 Tax=Azohydromonas caseinilytica TaxID=2728836 RepID=A0A848F780_9BURK|nr:HlyD family efflux transporter periplasmic adaptor subunit [Azohydromonas caseinilytica]NML14110.1 HlyD family efflux transporter periplasmic adaptor subunit [Azohydromonas caseinilytica]
MVNATAGAATPDAPAAAKTVIAPTPAVAAVPEVRRPALSLPARAPAAPPPWPELRQDLQLHHAPALHDGTPSWTLHDPVRHRFTRIDWITYEVLRCWWMADPALIAEQVNAHTTLSISREHVLRVLDFAHRHELLQPTAPPRGPEAEPGLKAVGTWLLHHYLFFRIPLFNPDRLLQRLLPAARRLGSRGFTRATLAALVLGLLAVARDWEAFRAQAVDLMSWRGLALYGLTLVAVKVAHEFGHAFVARAHGCRVPTMGAAFMVLWPVAYTDTSEVWRLSDARARLQVALAGVRTELSIAAWATLAWALLPEGPLRTAAFILGTLTWVGTVLVNLSPFMRFDGYFVLCDLLDQPNLHERSFALARWWLRRALLGWQAPPPEELPPARRRLWVAFAFATWAYRLVLYLGIAWLVYHFAIKAVGIVLFAVEMGWFVMRPVIQELRAWHAGRTHWRGSARQRRSAAVLAALAVLGFIPLPSHESAGALLQPAQHLALRLPATAVMEAVHVQPGQRVKAGAPLLEASAAALEQRLQAAQVQVRRLQAQVAGASVDTVQQAQWGSLQEQLVTARREVEAVQEEIERLRPRAPFDGVVLALEDGLRPGLVVSPQQTLLQFAASGRWRVVAYAGENAARALRPGDESSFMADAAPLRRLSARVTSVAPHASTVLGEPLLAQAHGGAVEAVPHGRELLLTQPLYRVELELLEDPALSLRQWRGHAVLPQPARSLWERLWTAGASVLVRELGF